MKFLGEIHAGHILTSTPWNNGASLVTQLLKNPAMQETPGSTPGLGRSPAGGKGHPLQYSGLEDSMDCIVHGVTKSQT